MPLQRRFSARAQSLKSSTIREILKVTANPEVISFAGGLPAPESFPVTAVRNAFEDVLTRSPQAALQYSTTDGYAPLREWIVRRVSTAATPILPEQVMIVSGSQQALDLVAKIFLDEGDRVLVETPTYLGALQAFSLFRPEYISVPSDEQGMDADAITEDMAQGAKLLYTLPNFQNPTGRLMSEARRQALVKQARALNLLVLEDDPYGALWYDTPPPESLLSRMPERVIYMGSFSKVLAPGLRLGYVIAPVSVIRKLEQAKQATDLHTSTIAQHAVFQVVKTGFLETHLPSVRARYQSQAQVMQQALEAYMPKAVRWNRPAGGMFMWVTLPTEWNAEHLLKKALDNKVAFVPGFPFYANDPENHTLRLAFVTVPPEKIESGIRTLGRLFGE